jgi:hypothetical protein
MSDEGTPAKVRLNDELGPDAPAPVRWYCVRQDGLATWCKDERDAIATAEQCAVSWPSHGPYRAVQLVDAAEVAAERERLRDCRLCANFTVQSGGCVSVLRCVGGDRYRATTPRQYWEARPIEPAPF